MAAALISLLPAGAAAAEPVPVAPDQHPLQLQDAVEVLEDPAGRLRIEDVVAAPGAGRFRPNPPGRELSFGRTSSAFWLRFRLTNETPQAIDLLLKVGFPLLDRIELYAPGREAVIVGDTLPFRERPLVTRHFVLPLTVAAGATQTYHLRAESAGVLAVPLEIASPERFLEQAHGAQLALGLLYGIFAGALLYNLFLWLSTRDAVHIYLVGHILSIGLALACVDGVAFQLWPRATGWQQWATDLSAVLVAASALLFVRELVASAERSPRLDRLLRLALLGQVATAAVTAPWGRSAFLPAAMLWLILIGMLLTVTVLWHARRGRLPARIYASAWVLFLVLMVGAAASSLRILPGFLDVLLVARGAAAVEVLLAAMAVAANLREARRALAASEEKFSRAFRSSPDALILTTLEDGRFLEVNDVFEKISGYSRAEAIGRTSDELGIWPAGQRQHLLDALSRDGSAHEWEGVALHQAGHQVPVQFSAERIELDGQTVLLATVRDVTERKLAAEQRESLIRELEAKNTELERFTYSASHDLRSPLVTILGFLGVLEKDTRAGDRERMEGDVGRIRAAANHMRQLLDEMLELSRVGRVVDPSGQVPLAAVAEEAASLFRRSIDEQEIELVIASDLPVVRGDRTRLVQVFQNLLVFELFRRLRPGVEGTGVGLALVRRIVESHGGRIWVESQGEGTGSTFCFMIPAGGEDAR